MDVLNVTEELTLNDVEVRHIIYQYQGLGVIQLMYLYLWIKTLIHITG